MSHVWSYVEAENVAGDCTPTSQLSRIRREGPGVYHVLDSVSPQRPHKYFGNVYWRWLTSFPQCPTEEETEMTFDEELRQHMWNRMSPITIDEAVPVENFHWQRPLINFSPSSNQGNEIDSDSAPKPSGRECTGVHEREILSNDASQVENSVPDLWAQGQVNDACQVENSVPDFWAQRPSPSSIARYILHSVFPIPPRYIPPEEK